MPTSSHNESQLRKRTLCITQVDKNRCFLSLWLQDLTVAGCSFEYPHKFPLDFNAMLMSRRELEMAPDGFNATLNTITAHGSSEECYPESEDGVMMS